MGGQRSAWRARLRSNRADEELGVTRPARVLLAEDDAALRRLLADKLRKDGYVVEEAESGLELLTRLGIQRGAFDLVISDIRMPGVSGLEVLEGLRNGYEPGSWAIPVILITAFGDPETHAEAARLGAVIFDKPFDVDDLRTCALNLVGPGQP